jgi:hypothetical protein
MASHKKEFLDRRVTCTLHQFAEKQKGVEHIARSTPYILLFNN